MSTYLCSLLGLKLQTVMILNNTSSKGKSASEALILESVIPQYDDRLFFELRVHYKKNTNSVHVTELRFASFLSHGFATKAVINPPERKLAKRTSVHCTGKDLEYQCFEIFEEVVHNFGKSDDKVV